VLGGHVETTKILLDSLEVSEDIEGPLGRLLLLALKSGHIDIAHLLVERRVDTSQLTAHGETSLYLAAQAGH
jgi:hypothetical protein